MLFFFQREGYEERLTEAQQKVLELTNELSEYEMNKNQSLDGSESRLLAELTEQYKRKQFYCHFIYMKTYLSKETHPIFILLFRSMRTHKAM